MIPIPYLAPISWYRQYLSPQLSVPSSHSLALNRCYIDSPNGSIRLTVPITKTSRDTSFNQILISEHGNWRHQHWNALVSSYRQTPYFDYYEEDFRPFYEEHNWTKLIDFNIALHEKIMELIGIKDYEVSQFQGSTTSDPGPYYQVFASRHGFLPNLSIVDLLFNMGPESIYWL